MTPDELTARYFLARLLWWRDDLERLDAEAIAQLVKVLREVKADILKRLDAEAAGLARVTDWNRERMRELDRWADEVLAGANAALVSTITESSIFAATASLATYNAMLSFEGKASAIQTVGMTAEQIRSWFQDTPLGAHASLQAWVDKAFSNGVKNSLLTTIRKAGVEGKGTAATVKRLMRTALDAGFQITEREATILTRTYTQTANNQAMETVYAANEDIIKGYKRVETLDNRTCQICFIGSTKVQPIGHLKGVSKRFYAGEVVVITTAAGNELVGTPHHPILTPGGWLPLNELQPGDQVINAVFTDGVGSGNAQHISMPTRFTKLFDSLCRDAFAEVTKVGAAAGDFHGDGMRPDKYVHIVRPATLLRDEVRYSSLHEHVESNLFPVIQDAVGFFGDSASFPLFKSSGKAFGMSRQLPVIVPESVINPICATGDCLSDITKSDATVIQLEKSLNVSLARRIPFISRRVLHDTKANQKTGDCGSCNSIFLGELASRHTISISIDNVVSVRRKTTAEHVYNLSCYEELYIANGLIVKNCALADGTVYGLHEKRPALPAHPGCRGLYTVITKSWRDFGIDLDELEAVARPWVLREPGAIGTGGRKIEEWGTTKEDFGGWWFSLNKTQQLKTSIGPVRRKLLLSGEVKWEQLTDKATGLPYTLEALGFDQAGNPLR